MAGLKDLIPIRLHIGFSKKSNEIKFNTDTLKDGDCKIESVWNWRKMRKVKYAIHNNGGKIEIYEISK